MPDATILISTSSTNSTVWLPYSTQPTTGTFSSSTDSASFVSYYSLYFALTPAPVPEAVAAERQAEERRFEAQLQHNVRVLEDGEDRALQLLEAHLSEAQREEFQRHRYFTVLSKDGQRRYRIKHGWAGNIERIDHQGKPIETLCAHPVSPVPIPDNLLTQKLWLETDEDAFRRIANIRRLAA